MAKIYAQRTEEVFSHSGSFAGSGSISSSAHCAGHSKLAGGFRSDVASETGSGVRVEQSLDGGLTWDIISSSAIATACAASAFDINIVGDAVRFFWRNGATAASAARANIYLRPI